jgi:hypothetical protein
VQPSINFGIFENGKQRITTDLLITGAAAENAVISKSEPKDFDTEVA